MLVLVVDSAEAVLSVLACMYSLQVVSDTDNKSQSRCFRFGSHDLGFYGKGEPRVLM